ncbi:MAG: hypothetical protein KJN90_01290 [Gammaproteobacteria bacterium]|nr:hypothetical protein [Gammaproteobacteria bacterium]
MGLLTGLTDAIGLTDSKAGERAAAAAQFNPYNIQTSFGGVDYDRQNRLFSSNLDPRLTGLSGGYLNELGGVSPEQTLSLFRQQAAPFNEQMLLGNENRLFSQGRMDFSPEYQEFGQTRGLYDAILNQDMGFQLQAAQEADRRRAALLGQIGGIQGMEMGLFSPAQQMGALGAGGQQMGAQLGMQGSMNTQNFLGSLLGGGLMGYGAGGGFNKLIG